MTKCVSLAAGRIHVAGRQLAEGRLVVVHGHADLVQIIPARRFSRRFARGLNGRQQQRHQDPDDGDDDEQLDKRKRR